MDPLLLGNYPEWLVSEWKHEELDGFYKTVEVPVQMPQNVFLFIILNGPINLGLNFRDGQESFKLAVDSETLSPTFKAFLWCLF